MPGFERGSLMLKDKSGAFYRLSWEEARTGKNRRALPAGTYTITGYRLLREDAQGKMWFLSATSHGIGEVHVRPGEEHKVRIDDTIRIQKGFAQDHSQVRMMIQGEHGSGMSIYRDGKRIPIAYRVTDRNGAILAQGNMTYG